MKRFDLLLRALAAAKARVRCVIAGEGPDRERLQQLAVRARHRGRGWSCRGGSPTSG